MYRLINKDPDGALTIENTETGARYQQTRDEDWSDALRCWRYALNARDTILDPILRRASIRNQWQLYYIAQRAIYRKIRPAPMPWDHIMFDPFVESSLNNDDDQLSLSL